LGGKYLPINAPPPTKLVFFDSGQMGRISSVKPDMVMVLIQNIRGGGFSNPLSAAVRFPKASLITTCPA
jgi:hypothetical protein